MRLRWLLLLAGTSVHCVSGAPEDVARGDAPRDDSATEPVVVPEPLPSQASGGDVPGARSDAGVARRDAAPAEDAGPLAPLHVVGRTDTRDPGGPRFGWPGTEIRARFSGDGVAIELGETGTSHYDVTVDGATRGVLVVSGARTTYAVASGLAPGVHELVLTKRTESFVGTTQLFGLAPLGGALVPSPAPGPRRIEMVGDSITCGYGVLGADASCPFEPETQAEPRAWGALAATGLSATRTSVCVSGIGVARNYGGETTDTMLERYTRALADDPTSTWSFADPADLVVVALGTNDFAGGKGDPGPVFAERYAALLATIRAKHPTAHVVAATSPMLSGANRTGLRAHLEAAIAARLEAGDANVSLLDLEEQRDADGYGCGHHPSAITQAKMAARLAAHARARLGW